MNPALIAKRLAVRVNSYLGSLNNREVMRSRLRGSGPQMSSSGAHELSLRGESNTIGVRVERTIMHDAEHGQLPYKRGELPFVDESVRSQAVVQNTQTEYAISYHLSSICW
jgi:hypothetical protein